MADSIQIEGLSKSFGKYSILDRLSLRVEQGSAYGLVGLNGAGKTTLIRLMLGLLKPDNGTISVSGFKPWEHLTPFYRQTGVVLESDGFWGNMSIVANLKIFAAAKDIPWAQAVAYFEEYWGDTELPRITKKVKYLSRGQKMQCALCRAFLGWPPVLFLDEPAVALDVGAYDHFRALVKNARSRGASLIISSHQLEAIDDLCDRAGMLRDKHLTELEPNAGSDADRWTVLSDENARWGEIILSNGGRDILCENSRWFFAVDNPLTSIPQIVRALVEEGCAMREVRPVGNEFSDVIRRMYRKSGSEGNRE